jgi:hypothetical protein
VKNLEKICMAVAFLMAGASAMMWYGQGVHTWLWQIIVMIWVAISYFKQKQIDKLNK